jgi:hypothetical protein
VKKDPEAGLPMLPDDIDPEIEKAVRTVKYTFPEKFLKFKTVRTALVFAVGPEPVPNFRMIERHYFKARGGGGWQQYPTKNKTPPENNSEHRQKTTRIHYLYSYCTKLRRKRVVFLFFLLRFVSTTRTSSSAATTSTLAFASRRPPTRGRPSTASPS